MQKIGSRRKLKVINDLLGECDSAGVKSSQEIEAEKVVEVPVDEVVK